MPAMAGVDQTAGADGNEYVPGNILEFLEANSRGPPPIPKIRVIPSNQTHHNNKPPPTMPATFPAAHEMLEEPSAERHRSSHSRSPHRRAVKHTYSKGRVKESATPLAYKSIKPACSVDEGRKSVLEKLAKSRESSQRTNETIEQGTQDVPASFLEAATKNISYAVSVDSKMEAVASTSSPESSPTAKSATSRRRRGLPTRSNPDIMARHWDDPQMTDAADSIDLFLISKSVAAPGSGPKAMTDMPAYLNDSDGARPLTEASQQHQGHGFRHTMYDLDNAPPAGDQEAELPDRIGQFGGLIPTVYTMDTLDRSCFATNSRRADVVAPNRYAGQTISRNSKFTGAGFRRSKLANNKSMGSTKPSQIAAAGPSPEPYSESNSYFHGSHEDMTQLPGWAGSSDDLHPHRLEKDGALVYSSPQTPLMP